MILDLGCSTKGKGGNVDAVDMERKDDSSAKKKRDAV
jgi:hypothetical protein